MSINSPTPSPTLNNISYGLAIGLCVLGFYDLAKDSKGIEERPVRTFALLAAYGYMGYRNTRSLINYSATVKANPNQSNTVMHQQQSQLNWDLGRALIVTAAEHLSAQPAVPLLRTAINAGFGAYCIHTAYKHKKLAGSTNTPS